MKTLGYIILWAVILGFFILKAPDGAVANFVYDSGRAIKATATTLFEGVTNGDQESRQAVH